MIKMTPQFVTADDFLTYWGIDLRERLKGNNSNKADIFLKRIEDRLMKWIDANTFRVFNWDTLKDDYDEYLKMTENNGICSGYMISRYGVKLDEEGFLYPHIDNKKCVDCGLCKKACPIIIQKKEKEL